MLNYGTPYNLRCISNSEILKLKKITLWINEIMFIAYDWPREYFTYAYKLLDIEFGHDI